MAYLGNTPTTQGFTPAIDFFSGNGATVAFTLSRPVASVAQVQATIENVPQNPGTAFTVSGNTITFDGAPPSGTNNIYVYYTSPITQVIQPGQGSVGTAQIQSGVTVSFADGSASAPSITNTDDSNTGIFFPAADTIAFAEGGAEAARLTSAGNMGVGTTSPAQRLVTETTDGLISVGPSGWRATERATVLIRTKTNNPAELDFQNTVSGSNYGWQISCRDSSTPNLNFYSNDNGFFTEQARIGFTGNLAFNSGYGSVATAYGCRAWVCFNGSGTLAIKASGNVSSVTDNGSGDYTVNFNIAMPDASYGIATCGVIPDDAGGAPAFFLRGPTGWGTNPTLKTTGQARFINRREANLDMADCSVSIFR